MEEQRLQISLRLKAARYLRGTRSGEGRHAGSAVPLSTDDLADREPLRRNGITKNRLQEIEQMSVTARDMELTQICVALDLPPAWFAAPTLAEITSVNPHVELGELHDLLARHVAQAEKAYRAISQIERRMGELERQRVILGREAAQETSQRTEEDRRQSEGPPPGPPR